MNILDATIVNLALPTIRDDLGVSTSGLQWVLVIYILTFGAGLLPLGRFGDIFGRKRVFIIGLLGFMATSFAAGIAPDVEILIIARGLQGLAAAAMVPQVLAIIHGLFSAEDRGKAIGMFGMINALGAVAGPIIGGFVISADLFGLGWRPIFLINLPQGLIALAGAIAFLPAQETRATGRADWIGAGFFAVAISAVIYPMIEGRGFGWPLWLVVFPVIAVAFALAFWRRQRWLDAKGRMQTLPSGLMGNSDYVFGVVSVMMMISALAGTMVVLAVFLQSGVGLTPAQAGLAIAPHPISAMVASLASARLGNRWLNLRVFAGVLALFCGMVWLRFASGYATSGADIMGPFLLIGGGGGAAFVALFQITLSHVSGEDAGAGSGALQALQQVGIALGIALVGQLFFGGINATNGLVEYRTALATAMLYPIGITAILGLLALQNIVTKRS
ncbi:MAG: MFS transporter [Rhodobacteraceae bacterium]|nr:MFS transporter [Paracoccaceae bacterium]